MRNMSLEGLNSLDVHCSSAFVEFTDLKALKSFLKLKYAFGRFEFNLNLFTAIIKTLFASIQVSSPSF